MSKIYTLFGMSLTRADELQEIVNPGEIVKQFVEGKLSNGEALSTAYGRLISKHATKQDIAYVMGQLGIHLGRMEQESTDMHKFIDMLTED